MKPELNTKSETTLQQFMTYGSSLCGAFVAAALQAFRGGMSFSFSMYTLLAAILGFAVFVLFWKLFFNGRKSKQSQFLFAVVIVVLIVGGLAGVLYPLRFVANTEFPNLVVGLIAASLALSGGALLLLGCKRFFDADEQKNSALPPGPRS